MFLWLIRPHVTKWYAPSPTSFAETVAKYGPRTQEGNAVEAFIVTLDGADVGYIQTYAIDIFPDYRERLDCEKGAAGVDLFIGEEQLLNRAWLAVLRRSSTRWSSAPALPHSRGPAKATGFVRAFERRGSRAGRRCAWTDDRVNASCACRVFPGLGYCGTGLVHQRPRLAPRHRAGEQPLLAGVSAEMAAGFVSGVCPSPIRRGHPFGSGRCAACRMRE